MNNSNRFAAASNKLMLQPARRATHEADADSIYLGARFEPHDAEYLKTLLSSSLACAQVIVVSNRQPFSHTMIDGQARLVQPASGLVTALEPVVRACGGTWIAHGNGKHDKQFVDSHDRCPAPVGQGSYTLRRIWMSADEQRGYCDGFSNSGLWPLSHMAHVRPVLTESDWHHYAVINERFADAVVAEARRCDPIVLIQDYHLALVPALVRARLPQATVIGFWHIPWPHPDQMSMCPWLPEILDGMLGCDVVGLQTPQHVQNFADLAARHGKNINTAPVPHIAHRAHITRIRHYPISIAWPGVDEQAGVACAQLCRDLIYAQYQLAKQCRLIIGVDRFDYTKGLIERLHAFEMLLDLHPEWRGVARFVQIASPTRIDLKEYTDYQLHVLGEVKRINIKFECAGGPPVVLINEHHDKNALNILYRAADVCVVSSLHDGMNLVCKEFVAARADERGVLLLSQFAGAANELTEALIVNPYHTLQVANALNQALLMTGDEQMHRMQALRATVKAANVYKWAADMLHDAIAVRETVPQLKNAVGTAGFFNSLPNAGMPCLSAI